MSASNQVIDNDTPLLESSLVTPPVNYDLGARPDAGVRRGSEDSEDSTLLPKVTMAASVFLHLLQVFITKQFPAPPWPTVDTTMGYEAVKFYRPMFHYLHPTPHTCAGILSAL